MFRVVRRLRQPKQRQKRFLQNILSLPMAKPQGASIQDQPSRFPFVKWLTPSGIDAWLHHIFPKKLGIST